METVRAARSASSSASCASGTSTGTGAPPAASERSTASTAWTTSRPSCADDRGVVPSRTAPQKSRISSASGSVASIFGETMSPVRYVSWNSPNVSGSGRDAPESKIRTGSPLVSSYTIIFSEPTIAVRRSLLGESQESSRCAIAPPSNRALMNATSGVSGITQARVSALTSVGSMPSQ